MPAYNVTVAPTLRVVGVITLTARSEEAAHTHAKQMAEQGKCGTLTWHITNDDQRIDEWNEEESSIDIEDVTEDSSCG